MPIVWSAESQTFHLRNDRISYILRVLEHGALGQLYFGGALAEARSYAHLLRREFVGFSNRAGRAGAARVPHSGDRGDYRVPALVVEQADGSRVLDLRYASHRVFSGKPALTNLPSTYVEGYGEADTLEILLADVAADLEVRLYYTIYQRSTGDRPRGARIRNVGALATHDPLRDERVAGSAGLGVGDAPVSGAWARERHVVRPLHPGRAASIGSLRGASSASAQPVRGPGKRPSATTEAGEAIGFCLVYSGNFLAEAEVEPFGTSRVRLASTRRASLWAARAGR
jgi:alpha-galactosidase